MTVINNNIYILAIFEISARGPSPK